MFSYYNKQFNFPEHDNNKILKIPLNDFYFILI
jgi:hypothetical protein